jgi:hypothetical protein
VFGRTDCSAATLAVLLTLVGCGRSAPAPPAAQARPPAACSLLTPDDVRAHTGDLSGTLSSTIDDTVGRDPAQCNYSLGGDVPPRVIGLQIRQAESAERAAGLHQAAQQGLDSLGGGTVPISGLGDQAFWVGGKLDQLHMLVGNRQLILTVQVERDPQATARALAARVLARLRSAG